MAVPASELQRQLDNELDQAITDRLNWQFPAAAIGSGDLRKSGDAKPEGNTREHGERIRRYTWRQTTGPQKVICVFCRQPKQNLADYYRDVSDHVSKRLQAPDGGARQKQMSGGGVIYSQWDRQRPDRTMTYHHKGLIVPRLAGQGQALVLPVLVTDYVQDRPLDEVVNGLCAQAGSSPERAEVCRAWARLLHDMGRAKIAHGDLTARSVVRLPDQQLFLLDNFWMYVPGADDPGLDRSPCPDDCSDPACWRPRRGTPPFDQAMDYFPALAIYVALLALVHKPDLWYRYGPNKCHNHYLLFAANDLDDPRASNLWGELDAEGARDRQLREALEELRTACLHPEQPMPAPRFMDEITDDDRRELADFEAALCRDNEREILQAWHQHDLLHDWDICAPYWPRVELARRRLEALQEFKGVTSQPDANDEAVVAAWSPILGGWSEATADRSLYKQAEQRVGVLYAWRAALQEGDDDALATAWEPLIARARQEYDAAQKAEDDGLIQALHADILYVLKDPQIEQVYGDATARQQKLAALRRAITAGDDYEIERLQGPGWSSGWRPVSPRVDLAKKRRQASATVQHILAGEASDESVMSAFNAAGVQSRLLQRWLTAEEWQKLAGVRRRQALLDIVQAALRSDDTVVARVYDPSVRERLTADERQRIDRALGTEQAGAAVASTALAVEGPAGAAVTASVTAAQTSMPEQGGRRTRFGTISEEEAQRGFGAWRRQRALPSLVNVLSSTNDAKAIVQAFAAAYAACPDVRDAPGFDRGMQTRLEAALAEEKALLKQAIDAGDEEDICRRCAELPEAMLNDDERERAKMARARREAHYRFRNAVRQADSFPSPRKEQTIVDGWDQILEGCSLLQEIERQWYIAARDRLAEMADRQAAAQANDDAAGQPVTTSGGASAAVALPDAKADTPAAPTTGMVEHESAAPAMVAERQPGNSEGTPATVSSAVESRQDVPES